MHCIREAPYQQRVKPLPERIEGSPVPTGVPLPEARVISLTERIEGTPVADGPLPEVQTGDGDRTDGKDRGPSAF